LVLKLQRRNPVCRNNFAWVREGATLNLCLQSILLIGLTVRGRMINSQALLNFPPIKRCRQGRKI